MSVWRRVMGSYLKLLSQIWIESHSQNLKKFSEAGNDPEICSADLLLWRGFPSDFSLNSAGSANRKFRDGIRNDADWEKKKQSNKDLSVLCKQVSILKPFRTATATTKKSKTTARLQTSALNYKWVSQLFDQHRAITITLQRGDKSDTASCLYQVWYSKSNDRCHEPSPEKLFLSEGLGSVWSRRLCALDEFLMDAFYCLSVSGNACVICHHCGAPVSLPASSRLHHWDGEHP